MSKHIQSSFYEGFQNMTAISEFTRQVNIPVDAKYVRVVKLNYGPQAALVGCYMLYASALTKSCIAIFHSGSSSEGTTKYPLSSTGAMSVKFEVFALTVGTGTKIPATVLIDDLIFQLEFS